MKIKVQKIEDKSLLHKKKIVKIEKQKYGTDVGYSFMQNTSAKFKIRDERKT